MKTGFSIELKIVTDNDTAVEILAILTKVSIHFIMVEEILLFSTPFDL